MNSARKKSNLKPIISISEACKLMNLSRARFYQLLDKGIFPQPVYQIKTRRPFYDLELQQQLIQIRETGVGANGQLMLFYSPRTKSTKLRKTKTIDPTVLMFKEFADALGDMDLNCSPKEVGIAIKELYPDGIDNEDDGTSTPRER